MHTHIVQQQRNSFQREMIIYAGAAMIESKKGAESSGRKQEVCARVCGEWVCMLGGVGVCVGGVCVKGLNS